MHDPGRPITIPAPPRPERWLDRRRLSLYAAILLVIELAGFAFFVAGTHGWIVRLEKPATTDFVSFYAAGALADEGKPALAYDRTAHLAAEERATAPGIDYQYFNYPPVFLLLCGMLAPLPYLVAFVLFEAATLALYLFVGLGVLGERSRPAFLALAAFPIVFWNFGLGQNAFLTAGLFGAATLLLEPRPVLAGILFGAMCYKPQFGLLLPLALAAGGYWRCFAAAAATVAALAALSLGLFGGATWAAFFATAGAAHSVYESGRITFAGMANVFGGARMLGAGVPVAYALQAAVALVAAAAVIAVWRLRLSLPTRAAMLAAAAVVAAPLVLWYDLLLGSVGALWLIRDRHSAAARGWEPVAFALLYIVLFCSPKFGAAWFPPLYPAVGLALFAITLGRVWREWRGATAETGSPRAHTSESRAAARGPSRQASPAR